MTPIRVVIADDHTPVREGLKQLLRNAGGIEVVGEAINGVEVIERLRATDAHLLVLDLSMPGTSSLELVRQVHAQKPQLRILAIGMQGQWPEGERAMRAGAAGYVAKDCLPRTLVDAVRKVAAGETYAPTGASTPLHAALSDREFQVLKLIGEGKAAADIAGLLDLSPKTVAAHRASILQKLGLETQAQLVRYAITQRLVDDGTG